MMVAAPEDVPSSPGSPATGLRRWGGHREFLAAGLRCRGETGREDSYHE
jgi:hypothetical protein